MSSQMEWKGSGGGKWVLLGAMFIALVIALPAQAERIDFATWSANESFMYQPDAVNMPAPATGTWMFQTSVYGAAFVGESGGSGIFTGSNNMTWNGNRLETPDIPNSYLGDYSSGGRARAEFNSYEPVNPGDHNFEITGFAMLVPNGGGPVFLGNGVDPLLEGVVRDFAIEESITENDLDLINGLLAFEVTGGLLTNPANGLNFNIGDFYNLTLSVQNASTPDVANNGDVLGFSWPISTGGGGTQLGLTIPEPATLALLGMGGLLMLRRRG